MVRFTLILSLALVGFATTAHAQTGTVLRFSGPGGAQARNAAVRGLRSADLVPINRVEDTARDLDVSLDSRRGRAEVADELELDFFVDGRVTGRGRAGRTQLRIYDSSGREVEASEARRPIGRAGRSDVQRRAGQLLEEIESGGRRDRARSRDRGDRDDRRSRRSRRDRDRDDDDDRYDDRDDDRDDRRSRRRSRRDRDDRDDDDRDRGDDRDDRYDDDRYDDDRDDDRYDDRDEEEEAPAWYDGDEDERPRDHDVEDADADAERGAGSLYVPRLLVRVGVDGRTRNTAVTLTDGLRRNFDAPLYPELTVHIETHPLSDHTNALRGIYVDLDLAFALKLSILERDPNNPAVTSPIGGRAWRFLLNAGYMILAADDRVRVGPVIGFGHDRFELGTNQTLPGSAYNHVRLGAVASFAAYDGAMVTRIDLGYRFLMGAGAMADAFGAGASGGAYDAGLSVGGALEVGFTYGVRVGYTRYSMDFTGDFADAEGDTASDAALNLGLSLGWIMR